ncbi:MAG: imidazole glycerol phosphate synthase subunit HisH [Bdellovibrionales bacterium]|nr:imidazole glycerol phosphate synthase subunit HisH [Bdellovibrionales bacterium]
MDQPQLPVLIIRTGVANIASVAAGLSRAGGSPTFTTCADEVATAERVVLPGVGTFGASMQTLAAHGLVEPLRERVSSGKPTLLVCVGFQVLFETSEESPGVKGLGILSGTVTRFPTGVRTPQFGWNDVDPEPSCRMLTAGFTYFANSFRATAHDDGWAAAWSDNGGPFIAALERGAVLACQFHPELSGQYGIALLRRWLQGEKR